MTEGQESSSAYGHNPNSPEMADLKRCGLQNTVAVNTILPLQLVCRALWYLQLAGQTVWERQHRCSSSCLFGKPPLCLAIKGPPRSRY